jgi:hypothetical protein
VKWGVPLALRNENVDESMHLTRIELVVFAGTFSHSYNLISTVQATTDEVAQLSPHYLTCPQLFS